MADVNFESHVQENGTVIAGREIAPENPLQYSDILKWSQCENTLVENCRVTGGREDCIDSVRGRAQVVRNTVLHPNGKNGVTIKGSIDGYEMNDVVFETHGSECDVEIGQHTLYCSPFGKNPTKNVRLINVRAMDGAPVKVKVWNAEKPYVSGGNVKVTKIPFVVVKAYFLWRWIELHWLKK